MSSETATPKIWTAGTLTYTRKGIAKLFWWLLWGDFAWSMRERAVVFVAALMVKGFGASDFLYSLLVISFPNFTNIFLMPIISYLSDRHRGRLGRRIPFLLFTTPFVVVGLLGLGLSPQLGEWLWRLLGSEQFNLNLAMLMVFGVFWVLLDFGVTLTTTIFMALSNDVVPQPLIGRFFALFRAVSLICAMVFNFWLLGWAKTHGPVIFLCLGVLYAVGLYSICLFVKEGEYPPPPPNSGGNPLRAAQQYLVDCFSMPYYRWVIGAYVLSVASVVPLNTYILFCAEHYGMGVENFGKINGLVFLLAFFMSYPCGMLADRFHPLRVGIVLMAGMAVLLTAGGLCIYNAMTLGIVYVAQAIVIMAFNTVMASYGQRLFPKEVFAQFYSALMIIQSLATVVIAPVVGKYLDLTGSHYSHTFVIGGGLACCGLASLCYVLKQYKKYGGDTDYHPPLPASYRRAETSEKTQEAEK